jgi:HEAT repeat protein
MQTLHGHFPNWAPGIRYAQGAADPRSSAAYALGEIGPVASEALPVLERFANVSDLPSSWYVNVAAKAAIIKIKSEPLGPHIEALRDMSDPQKWYRKALLVGQFGTNAVAAVPLLLAALNSTNNGLIQDHALIALGEIHSQPELCLPAIAAFLNSPRIGSRTKAMGALMQFGPAARGAVPLIEQSLSDPNWVTRYLATNALKKIDAAAAKRAGIP